MWSRVTNDYSSQALQIISTLDPSALVRKLTSLTLDTDAASNADCLLNRKWLMLEHQPFSVYAGVRYRT